MIRKVIGFWIYNRPVAMNKAWLEQEVKKGWNYIYDPRVRRPDEF